MLPESHIGRWSSGEPIDTTGVPRTRVFGHCIYSARILECYEAKNGGSFTAHYDIVSPPDAPQVIGELACVEEVMPPRPPQIQGFSESVRLPMMDRWGYSAAREADQRKREWAEVTHGA